MKNILLSCSLLGMFFANAQVASLNENFEDADTSTNTGFGPYAPLPYNNWTSNATYPKAYIGVSNNNKQLSGYSFFDAYSPIFFITPELVSVEGTLKFVFGGRSGSLQIGTIANNNNLDSFTLVKEYNVGSSQNVEIEIPSSSDKFIAFKYIPNATHRAFAMDNVIFTPKNLSTSEITNKTTPKFAVDNFRNQIIFANNNIRSVKIFSANGSLISNEKVVQSQVNISKLNSGVYFIIIEENNGNTTKSKFIKK